LCFFSLFAVLAPAQSTLSVQADRVVAQPNLRVTTRLKGHVPSWATSANDAGAVSPETSLRLTFVLSRSPELQAAFTQFLADQQNPASPRYHQWLTPEQIDVWEVHEAFSAQALGVLRELPNQLGGFTIPDERLTPNGGAVAIGHPFGASGTRYVLTLATELRERNARYGALGVCIGSGQGVAVVLENPRAA